MPRKFVTLRSTKFYHAFSAFSVKLNRRYWQRRSKSNTKQRRLINATFDKIDTAVQCNTPRPRCSRLGVEFQCDTASRGLVLLCCSFFSYYKKTCNCSNFFIRFKKLPNFWMKMNEVKMHSKVITHLAKQKSAEGKCYRKKAEELQDSMWSTTTAIERNRSRTSFL